MAWPSGDHTSSVMLERPNKTTPTAGAGIACSKDVKICNKLLPCIVDVQRGASTFVSNGGCAAVMEVLSTIKLVDSNLPLDDGIADGMTILHKATISSKSRSGDGDR